MNTPAAPGGATGEWSSWEPLLTQFAQATLCTATLYDAAGEVAIGPLVGSDTGVVLAHSAFFRPGGEGRRFEQALAAMAAHGLDVARSLYMDQLAVVAVPVVMYGQAQGAVVFGWLPITFASALGAERIAAAAQTDARRLWAVLRLQSPLGHARMDLYARFLASLVSAHARLRETLSEIAASTRLREESLARVAHELRTPLSSVMLRLSGLLNTPLDKPQEIRTALDAIIGNVREEARLIDDIVDSARSQTGQLSMTSATCEMRDIVAGAVDTILPQALAKNVAVEVQWGEEPALVEGDTGRLRQAFWNLLSNAVKFTPAGGKVLVQHRRRESTHDIAVRDTGAGIQRHMLAKVFDPFVRERSNNDSGLGLGLSIARHIVELHGGRILVDSDGPGSGSTFTVVLPVPRPATQGK